MAATNRPRSRWLQSSLIGLFVGVAIIGISLAVRKHYDEPHLGRRTFNIAREREDELLSLSDRNHHDGPHLRRQAIVDAEWEDGLLLHEEQTFTFADGKQYRFLLFGSWHVELRGTNLYKIVIANDDYGLMTSGIFGGIWQSSSIAAANGRTILEVNCWHRHRSGTHCYDISPKRITEIACD